MIIYVDQIPEDGVLRLEGDEPAEILALASDDDFRAAAPVHYNLSAQRVSGGLLVRGTLSAELETRCARCTQICSTRVEDSSFLRDYSEVFETEEVDITEDIREDVLLNLPHFPMCSEDCRGLCVRCGKDLNQGPCACSNQEGSGAWGALDSLSL